MRGGVVLTRAPLCILAWAVGGRVFICGLWEQSKSARGRVSEVVSEGFGQERDYDKELFDGRVERIPVWRKRVNERDSVPI